jgi:hypothetical protein
MGSMAMGECENWQKKILHWTINIPKKDMEDYHWAMFTHAMDFFQECASLKKLILEHLLTNLLNWFVNKGFGFPWQPPIKPSKQLYVTSGKWA